VDVYITPSDQRMRIKEVTSVSDSRLRSIVFDCAQPSALARFWAAALGYTVRPYDEAEIDRLRAAGFTIETAPSVVIDPPGAGPTIWFNRVPEPKLTKNRVHLDLNLDRLGDVEQLIELGATTLRSADEVPDEPWFVMADPEGNEFDAFVPQAHAGSPD
jgi:hypothetical protein